MIPDKYRWTLVAVLGSGMLVPALGSYGLWDPIEIQQADVAQDVANSDSFHDVTVNAKYGNRHVLSVWLVALGIKLLGINELACRLPLALCGVVTLLLAYRVGRRLFSTGAGLASALVLGTTPAFIFQSRLLASDVAFYASILASLGGLAAYLWPADGKRSLLDLGLGAIGLVTGFLAQGLVLGVVFPLACLLLSLVLAWRTRIAPAATEEVGEGPYRSAAVDVAGELTVGASVRKGAGGLVLALVVAAGAIGLLLLLLKPGPFLLLGGELRRMAFPPTFEEPFKKLGFGFFPWIGLLLPALALFVADLRPRADERPREALGKILILVVLAGAYVLHVFWAAYLGSIRFPALPWAAVAVGVLAHEIWSGRRTVHRMWALVAVALILILQQDFIGTPDTLAFSHLTEPAKYPIELNIKTALRIFGPLLAVFFFFSLGGTPHPIQYRPDPSAGEGGSRLLRWILFCWKGVVRGLIFLTNTLGNALRFLLGTSGRRSHVAVGLVALAFGGWCGFYLLPQLSLHLSNKALYGTFHKCRSGGEKLAQYQVSGRGAAYYNDGQIMEVQDQNHLFNLLREDHRWFILVPAQQLAPIDQAARQQRVTYFVLDDRSSQYLILSNRLIGRCKVDHNPLRKYVLSKEPRPAKVLRANFENRVELLGYDVADVVTRGGKFTITLYFKVTGQMPSGYKLFIHFDQPANRFHGDHEPLDGKYPTEYWLPGDYIVDPHEVEIPFITTPSGSYNIYMGFWLGSERLKVTDGPNDGVNRVPLGTLRVR